MDVFFIFSFVSAYNDLFPYIPWRRRSMNLFYPNKCLSFFTFNATGCKIHSTKYYQEVVNLLRKKTGSFISWLIILSLCFNFFGLPGVASSNNDYTATYTNSTATALPSTTASITSTVTATYTPTTTTKSTQTGLTVHFKKPSSWNSAIRIHYWNLNPASVPISGAYGNPDEVGWK